MEHNPLQLETVVRRVCYFLEGLEVLKFVRPVCKLWQQVAEDQTYWKPIKNLSYSNFHDENDSKDIEQNNDNNHNHNDNEVIIKDSGQDNNINYSDNCTGRLYTSRIVEIMRVFDEDLVGSLPSYSAQGPWYRTLGGPFSVEVMPWDYVVQSTPHTYILNQDWSEIVLSRLWLNVINKVAGQYTVSQGLDSRGHEWAELVFKLDLKNQQEKWDEISLNRDKLALVAIIGVQHHKHEGEAKAFLVSGNTPLPLKRTQPEAYPGNRVFTSRAETPLIQGNDSQFQIIILSIKPEKERRIHLGIRGRSKAGGLQGPTVLFTGLRLLPARIPEMLKENQKMLGENSFVGLSWDKTDSSENS